jgi:hypothetical protein
MYLQVVSCEEKSQMSQILQQYFLFVVQRLIWKHKYDACEKCDSLKIKNYAENDKTAATCIE